MCSTKQKIASTMREMMGKKSFDRITVKDLMDATNMNRQSFYYHFRDTRDVLMWLCRENLFTSLINSDLDFSDWIVYALTLLDQDRVFYRQVIAAAQMDFVRELGERAVFPRVRALLHGDLVQLDENQTFAAEFLSNAVVDYFLRFATCRDPLDAADRRRKIQYLIAQIKTGR